MPLDTTDITAMIRPSGLTATSVTVLHCSKAYTKVRLLFCSIGTLEGLQHVGRMPMTFYHHQVSVTDTSHVGEPAIAEADADVSLPRKA